ncbi:MAG TPA: hypothetical protein DEG17_11755 [Cyanobacteria bacterium UBA11149]|nr:hypothetical protein [Cyanobacteria bacterium UBA11367]HBE59777.1 hypothetical protein [Cyanobacteria bacterium UBA11366]HBK64263.1 hypothetical protein [Cyanobacteria bacterium UBA11166]HBR72351.1 hypothetical protein [Cyanobacteria bacterium UBA11159]HBS70864.1 hypothetical protein [Cyanobacteria bacterium UBA11153]HBW89520.1 hypothetical protein [Cyanobacteria bacterium UBA11149]HCA94940.1 hypothetical protein [Cyanobacteria bacterium UBA9226]
MSYHHLQQQFPRISLAKTLNLEGYITIERERISPSRILFHGIRFNLDKDVLLQIQYARDTNRRLQISPELLASLRYYSLIDGENHFQSGLTFCTYYAKENSKEALIQTMISMDGDIVQQIKRDCLDVPHFYRQLATCHYWLIEQLLSQLRLGSFVRLNLAIAILSWLVALLIVGVIAILFISVCLNYPWLFLVAIVMTWLLQLGCKWLLGLFLLRIRRWILHRILWGFLSDKPGDKAMAKQILVWLGD